MLLHVAVYNQQGQLLTLPLQDTSDGYIISSIEGLDPVAASIVSSSFAQQDGEQYQGARREKRNLVFNLEFDPDFLDTSVESLRKNLYRFLMPKTEARFRFVFDDQPTVGITGRTETFESELFTSEPQASISVLCMDPDFVELNETTFDGNSTSGSTSSNIAYGGSVDTGIVLSIFINRSVSSILVHSAPTGEPVQTMEIAGSLIAGDILTISTIAGQKYVRLSRAGVTTSYLYALSPSSIFVTLRPGDNAFRVQIPGAAIPYTMSYYNRHGGL